LQKQDSAVLTSRNISYFEPTRAEVPHPRVANILTGPAREVRDSTCAAHVVTELVTEDDRTCGQLLEAAKAGDRASLDCLLARERPRALAAALRVLHHRDDAEDAVQEAFVKIWRALPAFEGRSSFSTWVHRIVTNASLDLMRKSVARAETVERPECSVQDQGAVLELALAVTPESVLADREVERLVDQAVAALPAAHRQAVELREFEDHSYQEIADSIACPIGTVMSRLHHARGRLARALRPSLAEALAA
jgi:RNA polymerase sigma-70 factor (ECF subfamily)